MVLVGIPAFDHQINAYLVARLLSWDVGFYPACGLQPVDRARNRIVEEFLASPASHLFFIDADTIPPEDALSKLLSLKKPVVSGLTPIIDGGAIRVSRYNAVDRGDREIKPDTGLHESRGVGASCLLIERSVFTKLKPPYFSFADNLNEDIFFIKKCLEQNIIPIVDSSVVCYHAKVAMFR